MAAIGGLAPDTTYHFRLVAENSGGVAYGDDQTFTTAAHGEPPETPLLRSGPGKTSPRSACAERPPVEYEMA